MARRSRPVSEENSYQCDAAERVKLRIRYLRWIQLFALASAVGATGAIFLSRGLSLMPASREHLVIYAAAASITVAIAIVAGLLVYKHGLILQIIEFRAVTTLPIIAERPSVTDSTELSSLVR